VSASSRSRALALASHTARAQEAGRTYRVTQITFAERNAATDAWLNSLRAMGFAEGKNLIYESIGIGLTEEQLLDSVNNSLAGKPDLLMAGGGPFIKAAMAATRTVPIVGISDDMVGEGNVASLARPGGNVTGVSILGTELNSKRQEILIEALPKARKMAVLADFGPQIAAHYEHLKMAARSSAVELSLLRAGNVEQIEATLKQAKEQGNEAVNVLASPVLFAHRQPLFAALRALRLPAIYQWPEGGRDGVMLAYGPSYFDAFRIWGLMAGKILRGARPSDLPIEQPTGFKLAVNLKTAREFTIELPKQFLQRADEVID
jgi:putative tryptophan/tyrosine transport system substrate-binding protein